MAALYAASLVAYFQGDFPAADPFAEQSVGVARELGDERGIWFAIDQIAAAAMNEGDYRQAAELFRDLLTTAKGLGDRLRIAGGLLEHGILGRLRSDLTDTVACCEESLRLFREAGDHWYIGQTLSNLGLAHFQQGQYGTAREEFAEALALRRELHDESGIAWSLLNLGDVELAQGEDTAARVRFAESLALLRVLGDRAGSADALASLGRVAWAQADYTTARACFVESLVIRRDLEHRSTMVDRAIG
jgi:tetratricopeptide (TPR) repeat protein